MASSSREKKEITTQCDGQGIKSFHTQKGRFLKCMTERECVFVSVSMCVCVRARVVFTVV